MFRTSANRIDNSASINGTTTFAIRELLITRSHDHALLFRWFRAGVEHVFGQAKKFHAVADVFRGHISRDSRRLENIINIVFGILAIQIGFNPLRVHTDILDPGAVRVARADGRARRIEDRKAARLQHDGLPLGNPALDIDIVDGRPVGPGPEPDAKSVNTRCDSRDFHVGQRVLVWWWGLWWFATIRYVSSESRNYVNLRWEWSAGISLHYKPRLVRPL